MKKVLDVASRRKQPVKADPTEVDLLVQIRDLLRDGNERQLAAANPSAHEQHPAG